MAEPFDSSAIEGLAVRSGVDYRQYQMRGYAESDSGPLLYVGLFDRGRPVLGGRVEDPELGGIGYWLDSLLGHSSRQFVMEAYPLNSHCCYFYTIVDLADSARTNYSDEVFSDLVFDMETVDVDGDGISEIVRDLGSFDYFHGPHAGSVFPKVVLKYSPKQRRYAVASTQFQNYLLRGIDSLKQIVGRCERDSTYDDGSSTHERCFPAIFEVVLDYIYAGRRDLGWEFFNKHYRATDKDEIKSDIENVLRGSSSYRMTYAE